MTHRHLFRRGVAVKIHQGRGNGAKRMRIQQRVDAAKRIVDRVHEQPSHRVDNEDRAAVGQRENAVAVAGRAGRKIDRAQQTRIAADIRNDLALVPNVIAGGDDVASRGVEIAAIFLGDTEAMRRVLAVDDDEVERQFAAQPFHVPGDHVAAGAAHHIAAKQYAH